MYYSIHINAVNIKLLGTDDLDLFELPKIIKLKNTGIYSIDFKSIFEIIKARSTEGINAIAIGFDGEVSDDRRIIQTSKISEWDGKEFVSELEKEFNTKVFLRSSKEEDSEHAEIITGFEVLKKLL